jgi:hypothetical protein
MIIMKLHGKYCTSLFVALFLLSPLAVLAFADQNNHYYGLSDKCCFSASENSVNPAQNHSNCETEEDNLNDAGASCPSHMHSISFSCPYTPFSACLETIETYKKLPNTYASIFVPPQ